MVTDRDPYLDPLEYELHLLSYPCVYLFGSFQKVTKICRTYFTLLDAVSLKCRLLPKDVSHPKDNGYCATYRNCNICCIVHFLIHCYPIHHYPTLQISLRPTESECHNNQLFAYDMNNFKLQKNVYIITTNMHVMSMQHFKRISSMLVFLCYVIFDIAHFL